jgi:hypothetical protein
MSHELQFQYGVTASTTVKAEIVDAAGRVWNGTSLVDKATLTLPAWRACLLAIPEVKDAGGLGTGLYRGDGPTAMDWTRPYTINYYDGETPSYADVVGVQQWHGYRSDPDWSDDVVPPPASADAPPVAQVRAQALTLIAEITSHPKPSYHIDGQRVDWNEYLAQLQRTVTWCDELLVRQSPREVHSQGYT